MTSSDTWLFELSPKPEIPIDAELIHLVCLLFDIQKEGGDTLKSRKKKMLSEYLDNVEFFALKKTLRT